MDEPFRLSMDELKKLTPYQIRNVYLREREKDGRIARKPKTDGNLTYKQIFTKTWWRRGLNAKQIQAKWEEYEKRQAAEAEAKHERDGPSRDVHQGKRRRLEG